MNKKIAALILATIFAVTVTTMAGATSVKCTVDSIENGKVILTCGDKADKLKIGGKVKVKNVIKRKAIEGC